MLPQFLYFLPFLSAVCIQGAVYALDQQSQHVTQQIAQESVQQKLDEKKNFSFPGAESQKGEDDDNEHDDTSWTGKKSKQVLCAGIALIGAGLGLYYFGGQSNHEQHDGSSTSEKRDLEQSPTHFGDRTGSKADEKLEQKAEDIVEDSGEGLMREWALPKQPLGNKGSVENKDESDSESRIMMAIADCDVVEAEPWIKYAARQNNNVCEWLRKEQEAKQPKKHKKKIKTTKNKNKKQLSKKLHELTRGLDQQCPQSNNCCQCFDPLFGLEIEGQNEVCEATEIYQLGDNNIVQPHSPLDRKRQDIKLEPVPIMPIDQLSEEQRQRADRLKLKLYNTVNTMCFFDQDWRPFFEQLSYQITQAECNACLELFQAAEGNDYRGHHFTRQVVAKKSDKLMSYMIAHGLDIDGLDEENNTVLGLHHHWVITKIPETLKTLLKDLKSKIPIESRSTMLRNQSKSIALLLRYGADPFKSVQGGGMTLADKICSRKCNSKIEKKLECYVKNYCLRNVFLNKTILNITPLPQELGKIITDYSESVDYSGSVNFSILRCLIQFNDALLAQRLLSATQKLLPSVDHETPFQDDLSWKIAEYLWPPKVNHLPQLYAAIVKYNKDITVKAEDIDQQIRAHINHRDEDGRTLLHDIALYPSRYPNDLFLTAMHYGANAWLKDAKGKKPSEYSQNFEISEYMLRDLKKKSADRVAALSKKIDEIGREDMALRSRLIKAGIL